MEFLEKYSDVKKRQPVGLRGHIRSLTLTGLSMLDKFGQVKSLLLKPRVQILYIHHVFKDEEKKLYQLLEELSKYHEFISYSDAVNKIINGKIDKPYLVFSSDDGLKNNIRAAEILAEFGAKSCFFINPSIIGENNIQKIKSFCDDRLIFPLVEFLTWKDVEYIQSLGHEIGSHTMDHINITEVNEDLIREDMEMSFKVIKEKCGNSDHFAFPYGRFFHFSEIGRKACFDVGFKSCATAERGCHVNPPRKLENEELCLLRDHLVLDWGLDHMMYFIVKSAKEASPSNNFYPYKKL